MGLKPSCEALLGQGLHGVCKRKKSVLLWKAEDVTSVGPRKFRGIYKLLEHVHIHTPNLRSRIPLVPLGLQRRTPGKAVCSFIPLFSSAMLAIRRWTLVPEEDKGCTNTALKTLCNLRVA